MLPLMATPLPTGVIARRADGYVTVASFLADVAALAARLPASGHMVNLCQDRVRFMVGFAAALCRGQVNLLPPSDAPLVLEQIAADFPDAYALCDAAIATTLPVVPYPDLPDLAETVSMPQFPEAQIAAILFTSGSTGRPQPHARSWGMLVRSARAAGAALGVSALRGADLIGTVAHQHSYGLESLVMLALTHGLVLRAERPFFPADIRAALDAAERRVLVTTPVHLRVLLEDGGATADLIVCATAPLPAEIAQAAEARFGCALMEIYGCSEAGQLATRRTAEAAEFTCLDGLDFYEDHLGVRVRNHDPAGMLAGEVLLSDRLVLHGAGRFELLGRTSDMVNIAGKRGSLAHLNAVLTGIEGVVDGVFALADAGGESRVPRLVAFAVAPGRSAADLQAELRRRIDAAFLPRPLHMVDQLPRNEVGKLTRAALETLLALQENA